MTEWISRVSTLPAYGIGALVMLILWVLQAELRFGPRARAVRPGSADRYSTLALSLSTAVPVLGFALAMRSHSLSAAWIPQWFRAAVLRGLPASAWFGVAIAGVGLLLRLWAVLRLRERYTRTLLVQARQSVERGGPYRWVRHPGYLGSLLCLNGVALASGNLITLLTSLAATTAAYGYRIKVEDQMLLAALGPAYAVYHRQIRAILPTLRPPQR